MSIRTIVICIAAIALMFFAFLGGRLSHQKQSLQLKSTGTDTAAAMVERLKLVYPKNDTDQRERLETTPAKSSGTTGIGITHQGSIGRLLNKLEGIDLSSEQRSQLQDVYNVVFEARQNYELLNAKAARLPSGTVIEIPSYEAFGAQLRGIVSAGFESVLGRDKAKAVQDQLGPQIDVENTYWGKFPQVIHAEVAPGEKQYRITRSINPTPENPDAFRQEIDSTLSAENLDVYGIYRDFLPPIN